MFVEFKVLSWSLKPIIMARQEKECAGCPVFGKCTISFCEEVRGGGVKVWDDVRNCTGLVTERIPGKLEISPAPGETYPIKPQDAFNNWIMGRIRDAMPSSV